MSRNSCVASGGVWLADNGRLPKRADSDLYITPRANVEIAFDFLIEHTPRFISENNCEPPHQQWRILDLGAGPGVWGEVARDIWPGAFIHGIESRRVVKPESYTYWSLIDMRSWNTVYADKPYDLVVGNPPYSLDEEAVRIGLDRVCDGGYVMMLLPLTFLTSQGRRDGLFKDHPLRYYAQFSERISWTANGKTPPRDHGLYVWQKGYRGPYQGFFLPNTRRKVAREKVAR